MKKILYALVIILAVQNCGINEKKQYFSNISKKYRDFDLLLIVPVNNGNKSIDVCISNTVLFNHVFSIHYNSEYNDFSDFLQLILNNKKSIEYDIIKDIPHKIINPKAGVFDSYKEKGLNGLIGCYLKKEGERFSSIYSVNEDDKYGLIKIMFENHYYISWNDYRACFVFTKIIDEEDD